MQNPQFHKINLILAKGSGYLKIFKMETVDSQLFLLCGSGTVSPSIDMVGLVGDRVNSILLYPGPKHPNASYQFLTFQVCHLW